MVLVSISSLLNSKGGGKGSSSLSSMEHSTESSARSLFNFLPTTVAGYCTEGSLGNVTETFQPGGATCADVKMKHRSTSSMSESSPASSNSTTNPDPCEFSLRTPVEVTNTTDGRTPRAVWTVEGVEDDDEEYDDDDDVDSDDTSGVARVSITGGGAPTVRGGDLSVACGP